MKIALVADMWHREVADGLIAGAAQALEEHGFEYRVFRSPSAFDVPLVVQEVLLSDWDGAVALGAVVKGASYHYLHVSRSVSSRLGRISLETRKPVGFGVLTVRTEGQALERAGLPSSKESKGREAAEWVIQSLSTLTEIRKG